MAVFDCTKINLKKNSSDKEKVKTLQTALKTLGYYTKTVDGSFGYYTDQAVKQFQQKYQLSVDGVFGPISCAKLNTLLSDKNTKATTTTTTTSTTKTGTTTSTAKKTVTDNTPEYAKKETYTLTVYPDVVVLPTTETNTDGTTVKTGGSIETETNFDCSKINLRKGDSGDNVKKLQTILKARGYYTRQIDSSFGKYTKSGVEKLQQALGVKVDGVFGPETCNKLQKTSTTSNAATGTSESKNKAYVIKNFRNRPNISIDLEGLSYEITVSLIYTTDLYSRIRKLQKTHFVYQKGLDTVIDHTGYISDVKISNEDDENFMELSIVGYTAFLEQNIDIPADKTGKKSELLKYFLELGGMKLNLDLTGLVDDEYTVKAQQAEKTSTSSGGGGGLVEVHGNDCTETNPLSARSYDIDVCKGNTKIGDSSANYAQDTKHMSAKEALYDIIDRFHYGPSLTSSAVYNNNRRCPKQMWSKTGKFWGNCADISRLVKAMMEVHGLKCGIRHAPSHYYNLIEVDGKVYKFDCCFKSGYTTARYGGELCNNLTKNGGPWQR